MQMFLPDNTGAGVAEQANGGYAAGVLDADLAETTWCAYAWPSSVGNSGNRSFFTNQGGDLVATQGNTVSYSGTLTVPSSNACFTGAGNTITGRVATGATGRDGNFWIQSG